MLAKAHSAEKWRAIIGYEGLYEVSDRGRVKSLVGRHATGPKIVKQWYAKGYAYVTLWRKGRRRGLRMSRVVLRAFSGPPPAGHHAAHLNDCRSDNRIENLAWVSPLENNRQVIRKGRHARGSQSGTAKITEEDVRMILEDWATERYTQREIGAKYGISRSAVSNIVCGTTWRHIERKPEAVKAWREKNQCPAR